MHNPFRLRATNRSLKAFADQTSATNQLMSGKCTQKFKNYDVLSKAQSKHKELMENALVVTYFYTILLQF